MKWMTFFSAFALTIVFTFWLVHAWYDAGYDYRVPIKAYCSGCSGNVDAFVLVGGEDGITLGGRKQLIWCNVTVGTSDSTVGYLYYDDNTDYVCINGDDDNYFVTSVDEGQGSSNGTTEDNLAVWYHMNTTTDSSKFGNDFTVTGATATSSGKYGGAYSFDNNDYLETDNAPMVWNESTFTIMAWVKQAAQADVDNIYSLNNFDGAAGAGLQTAIQADGDLQLQVSTVGSWGFDLVTTDQPISVGTWYHIVFAANDTHFIAYINGTEYASSAYQTWGSATAMNSKIGAVHYDTSSYTNYFNGIIDEFRLYNRTLSADEIRRAYNSSAYAGSQEEGSGDSVPTSTLITPADGSTDADGSFTLNCTCSDDKDIDNATFWHNGTGTWHANATNTSVDGTWDFAENVVNVGATRQTVIWNCLCVDNASQSDWANSNYTVNIDTGTPYMIAYEDHNITTSDEQGLITMIYGDVDNDYKREYVYTELTATSGREREVYIIEEDGTITKAIDKGSGDSNFFYFGWLDIIDFDSDGDLDLVSGEAEDSDVSMWFWQLNDSYGLINDEEIDPSSVANSRYTKPKSWSRWNTSTDNYQVITGYCGSGGIDCVYGDYGSFGKNNIADMANTVEDTIAYDVDGDGWDEVFAVEGFYYGSGTGTFNIHKLVIADGCTLSSNDTVFTFPAQTIVQFAEGIRDIDGDGYNELVMLIFNEGTDTVNVSAFNITATGTLQHDFNIATASTTKLAWSCISNDHDKDGDYEVSCIWRDTDEVNKRFVIYDCPSGSCTTNTIYAGNTHTEASGDSPDWLHMGFGHEPEGVFPMAGFTYDGIAWIINYTLPIINQTHFNDSEKLSIKYTPFDSGANSSALVVHREFWCNDTRMAYEAQTVSNATEYDWMILSGNTSTGDVCHGSFMVDDGYENSTRHNSTDVTILSGPDTTKPNVDFVAPTATNGTEAADKDYITWNMTVSEDIGSCNFEINGTNQTGTQIDDGSSSYCYYNETSISGNVTRCAWGHASDGSSNWNTTLLYVCRSTNEQADAIAPTITIDNPDNTSYSTYPININVTVNEDSDSCLYNLDGGTNYTLLNDSMTNWFIENQTAVANATTVNLEVYCNDTSGNFGFNDTIWFTYETSADLTAPTITIDNPDNTSYSTLPININLTVSESANWCGYNIDGGSNTTMTGTGTDWDYPISSTTEALHQLNVYCNDTAGNMGENTSLWFTYDIETYSCNSCASCTGYIQNASAYETVQLTADITGDDGNCVEFSGADNIKFDCQGYIIGGDYDINGIGIHLNDSSDNNIIQGCTNISYFASNIYAEDSLNLTIENTTSYFAATIGIYLQNTNESTLFGVNAYPDQELHAIAVVGRENNISYVRVTNATTDADLTSGIYLNSFDESSVAHADIENVPYGIYITSSTNLTFYNITITNSTEDGFYAEDSLNVTLKSASAISSITSSSYGIALNTVNSSAFLNMNLSYNEFPLYVLYSNNNTFQNLTSSQDGDVFLISSSHGNTINDSVIDELSIWNGDPVYAIISPSYNHIYNNNITQSFGNQLGGDEPINYFNTTKTVATNIVGGPNIGGNYWSSYSGNDFDGDGIGDTSYTIYGSITDDLPLVVSNFGTITATTPDGDQNWTFSTTNGGEELLTINFTSTGNVNNTIYFTLNEDLANGTVVSINSTINLSLDDTQDSTLNLSINSSCPTGVYEGNLTWTSYNDSSQTGNITINFTVSAASANVDITNSTWSAAFTAGDTVSRYFEVNNTGDYNATHCNMSYSGSAGSCSFDTSDFTVQNTSSVQVRATFSGSSAGSDSSARVVVTCTATASGGTDSDSVTGSISISAASSPGGGGGVTVPPDNCGSYNAYPTGTFSGFNEPGKEISAFYLRIDNGNTTQLYSGILSEELLTYCQVTDYPQEATPVNGFAMFTIHCTAPDNRTSGHFYFTTDTGCDDSRPITIYPSSGVWSEISNWLFETVTGNPVENATKSDWMIIYGIIIIIIIIVMVILFA